MEPKAGPESKVSATGKHINQRKSVKARLGSGFVGSLLKMNEFTLIMIGALVVTVLVFFLFFRSPVAEEVPRNEEVPRPEVAEPANTGLADPGLEKRISDLEVSLSRIVSSSGDLDGDGLVASRAVSNLDQRVTRLEGAMTLKLDAVLERLAKMEDKVAALKKASVPATPAVKAKPVKTVATKKPAKKKTSVFHTVKKGETLWSISQKYKTSVARVRQLNKFSAQDKIYPGNTIMVR